MKKNFKVPEIVELDFKDTAVTCGVGKKKVFATSGVRLMVTNDCFTTNSWLSGGYGGLAVDDSDPIEIEEDNTED
ncbi:MAG: hypothetical protein J6Y89_03760 [Lachnospiraceae bacterium]|nr:hypothetical protein [Lachnospiraceae bacterium]